VDPGGGYWGRVSPFRAGFGCRCPRCGQGRLFAGFLTVVARCARCGLDLEAQDSGDGPAVFVIFVVGFAVTAAALIVEIKYEPPVWLHLVLWIPAILALCLGLLRPFKAIMIALQYRNRSGEGGSSWQ